MNTLKSLNAVNVELDIDLDASPHETSWELRGPLPNPTLLDGVTYDYYTTPHAKVHETFELEPGQYWFLLNDLADNGIENGSFNLVADLVDGQVILAKGDGNFGNGKLFQFTIPGGQESSIEVSKDGYFRGSLTSR
jgi:hypothetical protein